MEQGVKPVLSKAFDIATKIFTRVPVYKLIFAGLVGPWLPEKYEAPFMHRMIGQYLEK